MNKTLLILRHEFLHTIRRTGFIIMTLIVPLIGLLVIGISQLVSGIARPTATPQIETVGYIDQAGGFEQYTSQGNIKLQLFNTPGEATAALLKGDIAEYFIIPRNYISNGAIARYTLKKELTPPPATVTAINKFLLGNLLAGVPSATVARIEAPANLVTITLTNTGAMASEQGGLENFIIPAVFSLLLALSIIFSSTYLLQGLAEEKETRLIEVLLSSVSTRQLLVGKVLGIGAAGLVQVGIWVISAPFLLRTASSTIGGFIGTIKLPADFLILAIIYFILGYLLFAVLSAGVGAITSSSREGQQLMGIFTLPLLAPLWFMSLLMLLPDHPLWTVLTIFPFTSPVEVMIRLGVSSIPAWQIAVSIAVLLLTIASGLLLTARVLRAYLLMYGKRPTIGEVIRNLRSG